MLRGAALHAGSGTLAAEEARIRTRLAQEHVSANLQAEQFWMIASLDDTRAAFSRRNARGHGGHGGSA